MKTDTAGALDALFSDGFDDNTPLYVQIVTRLQSLIDSGRLPEGTTLPSERRLAEQLGVSRITAQHSYNELRRMGAISSHGRRGSIVQARSKRISSRMHRLRGFTEEMLELGRQPSSRIVLREVVQDRQVATIFGQPSSVPLLRLHRVRYADGMPMSTERAWYNLSAVPALAEADLSRSVYDLLAQHGQALAHCEQVIEAIMPTPEDCAVFGMDEPTPCVLIKRRSFSHDDLMLEYVEGTFRGDVYSYRMTLRV